MSTNWNRRNGFVVTTTYVTSCILLLGVFSKIAKFDDFLNYLDRLKWLSWIPARLVAVAVPSIEFSLAIVLIVESSNTIARKLVIWLFGFFLLFQILTLIPGASLATGTCPCLGKLSAGAGPAVRIGVDAVLFLSAIWSYRILRSTSQDNAVTASV